MMSKEETLEQTYWDFDARRSGHSEFKLNPQSERDAFKSSIRGSGLLSKYTVNCDQIAWLYNALERYIDTNEKPAVSRAGEMKVYGCMYEIMEVLGLEFEDDAARNNGTPRDARRRLK